MTDLTPYLNPHEQKTIGPLYLEQSAAQSIAEILTTHGSSSFATPDKYCPIVAASVASFVGEGKGYMQSKWFREQPVHAVSALTLRNPDGEIISLAVMHLVRRASGPGYVLVHPTLSPLPDEYYDQRVIEETKVEMGIF